jgi:hypothetical protein
MPSVCSTGGALYGHPLLLLIKFSRNRLCASGKPSKHRSPEGSGRQWQNAENCTENSAKSLPGSWLRRKAWSQKLKSVAKSPDSFRNALLCCLFASSVQLTGAGLLGSGKNCCRPILQRAFFSIVITACQKSLLSKFVLLDLLRVWNFVHGLISRDFRWMALTKILEHCLYRERAV